ncbi:Dfp1/Him1, central region-domain-containing protein [Xylariaceae sp. FL0804]|nr:Dfp1/Him1, central region-domain-containing protein [Xylariaceae sp. FL0804]
MSSRRIPLSSNQNAVNSPLRGSAAIKQKRSLAQLQREESYGQPPPAKKQAVEAGGQRSLKSPSQHSRVTKSLIPVQSSRNANSYENKVARERASHQQPGHKESSTSKYTEADVQEIKTWQQHHRARFPKSVFYFDKVPNDVSHNLKKQISTLGGREAAFFSIEITHVITTRQIPSGDGVSQRNEQGTVGEKDTQDHDADQEQADTINPSLLTRTSEHSTKRRIFDAELRARKLLPQPQGSAAKQPRQSRDILLRAKEMGKKVYSLDKFQRMLSLLMENDPYVSAELAYGGRSTRRAIAESRTTEDRNLLRLLQNERVNGPSDRDPTVLARELHHFKGPYIYVYDIEEKQKPIMVREYPKIADKMEEGQTKNNWLAKGTWPQFQSAALGRCPFVEDSDIRDARTQARRKARESRAETNIKPALQPSKMAPPKPVTGKRTLGDMEQGGHSRPSSITSIDFPQPSKPVMRHDMNFSRNAFTSRAAPGRVLGGEPVASGVQPSNVTSAIRSQMISSTAATPGVIAGLSKEVHGLQRQVLKRNSTATSQDLSSRHTGDTSFRDDSSAKRSLTMGRTSSRKLAEEVGAKKEKGDAPRAEKHEPREVKQLKPGYCENCGEKYADFDEHIESRKHRKFAEDDGNWVELDELLSQLERIPKRKAFASWTPSLPDHE